MKVRWGVSRHAAYTPLLRTSQKKIPFTRSRQRSLASKARPWTSAHAKPSRNYVTLSDTDTVKLSLPLRMLPETSMQRTWEVVGKNIDLAFKPDNYTLALLLTTHAKRCAM